MGLTDRLTALDERVLGKERVERWRARSAEQEMATVPGAPLLVASSFVLAGFGLVMASLIADGLGWEVPMRIRLSPDSLYFLIIVNAAGMMMLVAARAFGLRTVGACLGVGLAGGLLTCATAGTSRSLVLVSTVGSAPLLGHVARKKPAKGERA